jgi:outer membrane lipoprotein-sorting protein
MVSIHSYLAERRVAQIRHLPCRRLSTCRRLLKFERPANRASVIQRTTSRSLGGPLVALLFWVAALVSDAADLSGLLDRWITVQTNLLTWSADLTQTRSLKVLSQPLVSTGKVWMVIPDRFRWELGQPAQTIALRQPNQLFIIYPRLKRAEKYPLNDQQPGPWRDALALLDATFPRNRADLESRFRVLSVAQTNSIVYLALQPKSALARKFMAEIQVSFHTNDFSPAATELRFSDGSSLRNEFTNVVFNAPLGVELFEAKLTPDFTVVEPLRR